MIRKSIIVIIMVISYSLPVSAQTQFGRYLGILKHSQIENDQLAKLDFVVSRQNGNELKLVGLLTLYFGDYESQEYVTYHFDSVTFNLLTGTLVFDQPDQEVTLIVNKFSNGQFEGKLRAVSNGDVGVLSMTRGDSVLPTRPLVQPLWGEYRGTCEGVGTVLQVQTQRSSNDSSRMGDPFGTYNISAQLAEIAPNACLSNSNLCVARVYDAGAYNFFEGQLELTGSQKILCNMTTTGLSCGDCELKRTSNEAVTLSTKQFPLRAGGYTERLDQIADRPVTESPTAQLSGTYQGYLFHERLGEYQSVSLNIVTYQGNGREGNSTLFISAVSTMYFGGFNSKEYITHRFNEREYPLLASQIVLERINGDVDAIVQLTQLGNGRAKGVWYSLLFGRVGTFELSNTGLQPLPTDAVVLGNIGGRYKGAGWTLDLQVIRESTPINTVNPFYPLNFKGSVRFQDAIANNRVSFGSYDFYTGKLSLQLEDDSLFSGYRKNNTSIMLKRPTPFQSSPLLPHRHQPYTKAPL